MRWPRGNPTFGELLALAIIFALVILLNLPHFH